MKLSQENEKRAELAYRAVLVYAQYAGKDTSGGNFEEAAVDFLASLMHLNQQYGDDFESWVREAKTRFEAAEQGASCTRYVEQVISMYVAGKENAYEAYKAAYGETHEQAEDEDDLAYVRRCAEQDFDDGPLGGAVYQEVYDGLLQDVGGPNAVSAAKPKPSGASM